MTHVPSRIKKNQPYLHILAHCKPRMRKSIIQNCPSDVIKCICEVALNSLHGNLHHNQSDLTRLKKHKRAIKLLTKRSVPLKAKREILGQRGGFLGVLIKPLLGLLGGLAGSVLGIGN